MLRYRLILITLALAALGASAAFWPFSSRREGLRLPGTVQSQEVRLASKVGGRVGAVLVADGQRVSAGQELVRLELPELEAQREQLRAKLAHARAELYKARNGPLASEVREAEAAYRAADARWRRTVAGPRPEEIEQAEQDKKSAEADLAAAADLLQRVTASRQAGTPEERHAVRSRRDRAAAALAAVRARLALLRAGNRTEDREEAKAERDRLKARLDQLRDGTREEDVARAEADLQHAVASLAEVEAKLKEASVCAREAGRVEVVSVRPGDVASANAPVVRMQRDGDLWVRVFVPETELGKVRVGQAVELTIDSHPGKTFRGSVYHVAGESEFTPRNVQSPDERRHQVFAVKVRVEAPEGVFKPGMAAQVFIPTEGE